MNTEYAKADEVRAISEKLIALFHPHLLGVRVEYVFLSRTPISQNRETWARIRKVSGLNAWLATELPEAEPEPFFVMEVAKPIWDALAPEQQIALVDHELAHAGYDEEKDTIALRGHDVEEFSAVVGRHGAWRESLAVFAQELKRASTASQESAAIARILERERRQLGELNA